MILNTFFYRLGEEALNRLEKQLTENSNPYSHMKNKVIENTNLFKSKPESSILYNLLSCEESSSTMPRSLLFPEYSRFEGDLPPRANTVSYSNQVHFEYLNLSPRPYSAPQSHPHISNQNIENILQHDFNPNELIYKINSKKSSSPIMESPISCSSDSFCDEPMDLSKAKDMLLKSVEEKALIDSWLVQMVFLINTTNKQYNTNLVELPPKIRLHLLQSSWHRILITYLYEHLSTKSTRFSLKLWEMLQAVIGITNQSMRTNRNIAAMFKSLIDELNVILIQIQNLNLDDISMNYFRIGLFLTGNYDENNSKNLRLVELFIKSKLENADLRLIREVMDNLLKLNPVLIETVFYGHLNGSVEKIIEQLFINS